jgi:hypothetical protein
VYNKRLSNEQIRRRSPQAQWTAATISEPRKYRSGFNFYTAITFHTESELCEKVERNDEYTTDDEGTDRVRSRSGARDRRLADNGCALRAALYHRGVSPSGAFCCVPLVAGGTGAPPSLRRRARLSKQMRPTLSLTPPTNHRSSISRRYND